MARRQAKNTSERKKLMKEVQSLLYNTKRREKRIAKEAEQKSNATSPAFRGKTYKSILKRTEGGLRGKTIRQLQALKNDLLYVKSLPTSYITGYHKYEPIFDRATKSLGRNTRLKAYDLWNKLVAEGGVYAIYKYELFNEIAKSYEVGNRSEKKIRDRVDKLAHEWYERDNLGSVKSQDMYRFKEEPMSPEEAQDVIDSITSNDSDRYDDPNNRPKPYIGTPSDWQNQRSRRKSTKRSKNPNRRRNTKR